MEMEKVIGKLMDAIDELVNLEGTFAEKKAAVEKYCDDSPSLQTALNEFTSWWIE